MMVFPTLAGARLQRDLLAAITLAAIAIPEQLATARLAGLPAAQGLLVFAASAVVLVVVCRDRHLSVGADSTIAPMVAATLAVVGTAQSVTLALLVGAILTLVWLLRLEWIARLMSKPVSAGMLAGIAVHIVVGRLPTLLNLDITDVSFWPTLAAVASQIGQAQVMTLAAALAVTTVCLVGSRLARRFPSPLVALVLIAGLATWLDPSGEILPRIPEVRASDLLHIPRVDPGAALTLLPTALSICFLCLSQTTVVQSAGPRHGPEMLRNAFGAVGLANVAAAAVGGFPVNSSPPRTEILRASGGTSQIAGIGAAVIGLALLWFGAGILSYLPAAALAGVLVFIALHILPLATLRDLVRRSPAEATIAFATMALVIGLPLLVGLPLAMLLSLLHAAVPLFRPSVVRLVQEPGTTIWWHQPQAAQPAQDEAILVLGLSSPINFVNAQSIADDIHDVVNTLAVPPRVLVLECAGVLSVDLTGADMLERLIEDFRRDGIQVALARLESDRAQGDLAAAGALANLGERFLFQSVEEASQFFLKQEPQGAEGAEARP